MPKLRVLWSLIVSLCFAGCAAQRATSSVPPAAAPRAEAARADKFALDAKQPARDLSLPTRSKILSEKQPELPSALGVAPEPPAERCELGDSKNPAGFYSADTWSEGQVVLTFDDGPHPGATPRVLALLKRLNLPATFFLVGRNINNKTYQLVQQMVAEGHTLGSHSYNHDVGMSVRDYGERSIQYIQGQHEVTRILIEMALMARSSSDFDSMFVRVFEKKSGTFLSGTALRTQFPTYRERHQTLLVERGYTDGRRPYPLVYSRPPAGTPYLGLSTPAQHRLYTAALERVGFLNVMWNGESGDADAARKTNVGFLSDNIRRYSRRGGILLIHDYIRHDALTASLERMAKDTSIEVVPLEQLVEKKFGCSSASLGVRLAPGQSLPGAHAAR